jgi:hypothetical protein
LSHLREAASAYRIDLHIHVPAVRAADLSLPPPAEGPTEIAARVAAAWATAAQAPKLWVKEWVETPVSPLTYDNVLIFSLEVAERVGFEPTVPARGTTAFETAPIDHSGTSPPQTLAQEPHTLNSPAPLRDAYRAHLASGTSS